MSVGIGQRELLRVVDLVAVPSTSWKTSVLGYGHNKNPPS